MKKWLKMFTHNCIIHPLMSFIPEKFADRLHVWHGDLVFGSAPDDAHYDFGFIEQKRVFLLQITELNPCFDEPYHRIEAAYSSYPTKKQLLDVARKLEVKSPYQMVHSCWGEVLYDEYTSVRYEIIGMELL